MTISGLGPHGERAASIDQIHLSPVEIAHAREGKFRVGIVLHTTASDWAKRQIAGILDVFARCETAIIEIVDCGFSPDEQIAALERLLGEQPDAIISLPVSNAKVAEAHRRVSEAGVRLLLLDNVPTGLLPGSDYVALVSADNFGLGAMAASLLADRLCQGASVGVITYISEFFVTNEREIAFAKWMRANRPDVRLAVGKFKTIEDAGHQALALILAQPDLAALFVVWDTPAIEVIRTLDEAGRRLPVVTIDLGHDAARDLASDGMICGIGAQQPYLQGTAVAQVCVHALLGKPTPSWIALPGLAVRRDNAVDSFKLLSGSELIL